MKAIDTCVLARFVLNDDEHQAEIARDIVKTGGFISLTVLLELGWLLRSRFGFRRQALAEILSGLLELPGLRFEKEEGLAWALGRVSSGADIADIIHLLAIGNAEAFMTFDNMVAEVGPDSPVPIELLR